MVDRAPSRIWTTNEGQQCGRPRRGAARSQKKPLSTCQFDDSFYWWPPLVKGWKIATVSATDPRYPWFQKNRLTGMFDGRRERERERETGWNTFRPINGRCLSTDRWLWLKIHPSRYILENYPINGKGREIINRDSGFVEWQSIK